MFTRIRNDVNGNPRYVCHFLHLNTASERYNNGLSIEQKYSLALWRAKQLGGKRFHNKQYGGGIAFVSYNLDDLKRDIEKATEE